MESPVRDNYILRIYRRDRDDPEKVVGLVEFIQTGEKKPFKSYEELCATLKETGIKHHERASPRLRRKRR